MKVLMPAVLRAFFKPFFHVIQYRSANFVKSSVTYLLGSVDVRTGAIERPACNESA